MEGIRGGAQGGLFRPGAAVVSRSGGGGGNNWARGYHGEGAALVEEAMDVLRREAEVRDQDTFALNSEIMYNNKNKALKHRRKGGMGTVSKRDL